MGGIDKLAWPVAGRPLLAHTLAALAAAADVDAIVVVTAADRETAVAAADWLPAKVRAVVPGGARRQDSVRGWVRRARAPGPGSGRDARRPGPRRRAAARRPGARRGRHRRRRPPRRGHPGRARSSRPSSSSMATGSSAPSIGRPSGRRRRHRACGGPSGAGRWPIPWPPTGTWTDEAALLEACRIAVHVVPGDPSNLKVTMPADLARVAADLSPAGSATRTGIGQDTHPFGPDAPLMLGGVDDPGRPAAGRPFRRRRRPARDRRRPAGRRGPRRPGRPVPGRRVDAARHRQRGAARGGRRAPGRRRLAPRHRGRDHRGGPAAAGRASRADACRHRRDDRARRRGGQRQGVDREPRWRRRGRAGRSRRWPSRPSGRSREASA